MLVDLSRKSLVEEMPASLDAVCSIGQSKSKRVSYSKLLLRTPMEPKASGFQRVTASDESWLFLYHSRDSVWAHRVTTFLIESDKNWHSKVFHFDLLVS
jgi:hypothetical protein